MSYFENFLLELEGRNFNILVLIKRRGIVKVYLFKKEKGKEGEKERRKDGINKKNFKYLLVIYICLGVWIFCVGMINIYSFRVGFKNVLREDI